MTRLRVKNEGGALAESGFWTRVRRRLSSKHFKGAEVSKGMGLFTNGLCRWHP